MGTSLHLRFISAAFAAIAMAHAPAIASPPVDSESSDSQLATYRETIDRGTAHFVARRFAEARQAFEDAFAIHPDPGLVFNIASCWRRDGHSDEALAEYRRFLTLAPNDDARRMLAEETIAALEAESPPPAVSSLEPETPPRPVRSIWRPIGLATTGVGAVGLIAGGVELVRAHFLTADPSTSQSSSADGQRDGNGQRDGRYDRNNDTSEPQSNGSDASASAKQRALVFGISGAVVTIAGVTMYVIGKRSERALRITATASSSGGQVMLGGRF